MEAFRHYAIQNLYRHSDHIKTINPCWASSYERHTFLFEHAVIDIMLATKDQNHKAEFMRCACN